MSRYLSACLVLALLALPGAARAQADALEKLSAAVLQIQARDCDGGQDKVASGFLWQSPGQAVSALHAVAGCAALTAYSERAREIRPARVAKVLRAADLVLLKLDQPFDLEPATPSARPPGVGDALKAVGYSYDAPTLTDRDLKIAAGTSQLRDMLPSRVADEIRAAGAPDLDLVILRLNGTLVPGFSGAPIVDAQNLVVGVGSGGIEGGAAAISWGIPIAQVAVLERSDEPVDAGFQQAASLFGADLPTGSGRSVRCGELTFRLMRTRPFERLAATADDPVALQQVAAHLQVPPGQLAAWSFDIWVHADSGAAIALPEGASPEEEDGYCSVENLAGLVVGFAGSEVDGPLDAQASSVAFETGIAEAFPQFFWQVDPAWTYPFPHVNGKDGMVVHRKSFYGISQFTGQPAAYATEALASRGQAFIGIAVIAPEVDYQLLAACQFDPVQPACQELRAQALARAPFVLGALLTTFPPQ
ncbi:S1 family peptidase [Geminicoccus roseus]|uniref:S1 family peptidase n=1 Tax=Geminicoccus roseus TaxID=404900 RepID=UPI00040925DA|nr:serine protease [Geminicoccus roseus]